MDIAQAIADEVRGEAYKRHISRKDLAVRTGLTEKTVSRKTNGRTAMTVEELFAFADALGISPTDLIDSAARSAAA